VNGIGERVWEDLRRRVPAGLGRGRVSAEVRIEAGRECGSDDQFDLPEFRQRIRKSAATNNSK
jgi:hypothetical protein